MQKRRTKNARRFCTRISPRSEIRSDMETAMMISDTATAPALAALYIHFSRIEREREAVTSKIFLVPYEAISL